MEPTSLGGKFNQGKSLKFTIMTPPGVSEGVISLARLFEESFFITDTTSLNNLTKS